MKEQEKVRLERCTPENTIVVFGLSEADQKRFIQLEQKGFRVLSDEKTHMIAVSAFLVVIDDIALQKSDNWSYEDTLTICSEIKNKYDFFCFVGDKTENIDTPKLSGKIYLPRATLENQKELTRFVLSVRKRYLTQKKRNIIRTSKLKNQLFIYEYAKRKRIFTTAELAKRLDVTTRSILRYLNDINDITLSLFYDKKMKKWLYISEIDEIEEWVAKI